MDNMHAELEDKGVIRALGRLRAAGNNLTPAMASIGRSFKSKAQLTFRSSTSPYGVPWKPIKHRQGQPLRDTGRLQRSLLYRESSNDVVVGTNVEYAPVHQYGHNGPVKVPTHVRTINQVFGRALPAPLVVKVKEHTKQLNVAARPFLPLGGLPSSWEKSATRAVVKHLKMAVNP